MFYKKYVFESKKTKARRLTRSIIIFTLLALTSFSLLCIYIPNFARNQNEIAQEIFYQKSPDLIAVFTGDVGRIGYTLKKAKKHPSARVFITGVYAKNSLKTLLHKQGKNLSVDAFLEQESHHIELDYLARNTVENGLATLNYLKKLKGHKTVLIISSDYHMVRISKIMETLNDNPDYHFYYESIRTNYKKTKNLKKLFKEVYKTVKSSMFLYLWDRDSNYFI